MGECIAQLRGGEPERLVNFSNLDDSERADALSCPSNLHRFAGPDPKTQSISLRIPDRPCVLINPRHLTFLPLPSCPRWSATASGSDAIGIYDEGMNDDAHLSLLNRRELLVGGCALASALYVQPTSAKSADHPLSALARSELRRRSQGAPSREYLDRLEAELTDLHRRGRWPLWQAVFEVTAAARSAGVVLLPEAPAMLGSLTAHLLQLGNVDPVQWDVALDYFLHGDGPGYADFSVANSANMDFVHHLRSTNVEIRPPKGDEPERAFVHFEPEAEAHVVVRLFRTPRLDVLQRAQDKGFDRDAVDLAAVSQLAAQGAPFAPPFDDEDTAWVAEGFTGFEEAAAALRLVSVETNGWESQTALNDLWRVYFARGNNVPPPCEPFVERTGELLLYNEQIGRILQAVAGFSLSEAKEFRCAARTLRPERMLPWREHFVRRARRVSGFAPADAHAVCDFLVRHPLVHWCRGSAVAETAEWIWTTHALRFLGGVV